MSATPDAVAPTSCVKTEPLQWDVDMEVQLFYAMAPHKPVGINKHFHMAAIWEKMSNSITRDITTEDIWKHLETLYDISILDDTEPIPFSTEETEFSLPENEFSEYMKKKSMDTTPLELIEQEDVPSSPHKASTPKSSLRSTSKDSKPRKESIASTKTRKESGSSHASTDTITNKSEKDFGSRSDRRRDSRDSNASGTRDSSSGHKSVSHKKTPKSRTGRPAAEPSWSEDKERSGRSRRRATTSTPPPIPAKRRRM